MFCVTGNSMYLAHKEEVLWPEKENPQVRSTVFWMKLMEDGLDAEDLFGEDGLLKRMKKRMAERILEAELTDHLGYEKHAPDGRNRGNSRNGKTTKTLKDDKGDLPVEIPRDREGSFDPKLIRKYQTRWPDFDDKIISMYARGMSTRDIQGHIEDLYGGVHLARTGLAGSPTP